MKGDGPKRDEGSMPEPGPVEYCHESRDTAQTVHARLRAGAELAWSIGT